jgi:hypothetical protein
VAVTDDGSTLTLKTEPAEFTAEFTLCGYQCGGATVIQEDDGKTRLKLQGTEGEIILKKDTTLSRYDAQPKGDRT